MNRHSTSQSTPQDLEQPPMWGHGFTMHATMVVPGPLQYGCWGTVPAIAGAVTMVPAMMMQAVPVQMPVVMVPVAQVRPTAVRG